MSQHPHNEHPIIRDLLAEIQRLRGLALKAQNESRAFYLDSMADGITIAVDIARPHLARES